MAKSMILSTLEYRGGQYELVVVTKTKAEGRDAILAFVKSDNLGLQYYDSYAEFVDGMIAHEVLDEGRVIIV